jgi:enamine deaminase RidA (YjgF/YER057c/UK114 family)
VLVGTSANFISCRTHLGVAYLSGVTPVADGKPRYVGKLGDALDVSQGREAARLAAVNAIARLKAAVGGDLRRITAVVRVEVFQRVTDGFGELSAVADAASDIFTQAFGDAGRHARAVVGVTTLPGGVPVELLVTATYR